MSAENDQTDNTDQKSESLMSKYMIWREKSLDYFNFTKQFLGESLGNLSAITQDKNVENMIKELYESQKRHNYLYFCVRQLLEQYQNILNSTDIMREAAANLQRDYASDVNLSGILGNSADILYQQSLATQKITEALTTVVDKLYTLCDFAIKDTASKAQEIVLSRVRLDSILGQENDYLKFSPDSHEYQKYNKKLETVRNEYEKKKEMFFNKQKMLEINRIETLTSLISFLNDALSQYYSGNSAKIPAALQGYKHNPSNYRK